MSVSEEKQIFTCFVCGMSGNVFSFIKDYENITFLEAVNRVANITGISLSQKINVVKKYDKEYKVFLLKQEFKAEKGNQVYSPRYYEIMVELFLLGETEYLTLIWWETEDSLSRLLIMSLFMCQDGDLNTERRIASFNIPPFALYCNRFKSDEANRRIQEIQLVQDNISNLRSQLRPVIKNCSSYK